MPADVTGGNCLEQFTWDQRDAAHKKLEEVIASNLYAWAECRETSVHVEVWVGPRK